MCDCADEIDAAPGVPGARGLSRIQPALLGSVSTVVSTYAKWAVLVIPSARATSQTGRR
jgi:nucleotide-binding universal stress UspA family protein